MARIERQSLHQEILRRVRDMIVEGRWPPGERIPELDVCDELGISRTPLREALKVLAAEGLIELLPSRGALVKRVAPDEARDMLELMGELEAFAGSHACARASDAEIAAIAELHRRMLGHYVEGRRRDYFRANQAIHDAIVAAAGNPTLREMHATLSARLKRLRFAGSDSSEFWRDAVAEHERILAALKARDGEALATILREHEANTWTRIRASVETAAAEPIDVPPRQRRSA